MRVVRRVAVAVGIAAFVVLATPSLADAALAITVPSSVNLGSVATGVSSLSGQMGTVTVTATGLVTSFVATVSTTTFVTGSATTPETIPKASISYWSGPATVSTGIAVRTPGQLTALQKVSLSSPATAFSAVGVSLVVVTDSTAWNPTIVVTIPAAAVSGTYTGTITHSVA